MKIKNPFNKDEQTLTPPPNDAIGGEDEYWESVFKAEEKEWRKWERERNAIENFKTYLEDCKKKREANDAVREYLLNEAKRGYDPIGIGNHEDRIMKPLFPAASSATVPAPIIPDLRGFKIGVSEDYYYFASWSEGAYTILHIKDHKMIETARIPEIELTGLFNKRKGKGK